MGTLDANAMAEAISVAMSAEWQAKKGEPLSELGKDDRDILFKAVARGVLGYLEAHRGEMMTTAVIAGPDPHVHALDFSVINK